MIELLDTTPDTNVLDAEYHRLLGFPRDYQPDDLAQQRAAEARAWYAQYGRPWTYARQLHTVAITNGSIHLDHETFTSSRLRSLLLDAHAHTAILAAVSAGPELEARAQQLWQEEKPDEYFFLEVYGSAVVEHLVTQLGARLCQWADPQQLAVLPHYSPGYPDWDIAQQPRLLNLLRSPTPKPAPERTEDPDPTSNRHSAFDNRHSTSPPSTLHLPPSLPLSSLDSGMLRPKKSLLAVFPITRDLTTARRLPTLTPCQNCSYAPCQYRRAPYRRAILQSEIALPDDPAQSQIDNRNSQIPDSPLTPNAKYHTNAKALARWSTDRLTLTPTEDGQLHATFRYEGSTCASTGRPLAFLYRVTLSPRADHYKILSLTCAPAPEDTGHQHMCRYQTQGPDLLKDIAADKPLLNHPLNDILTFPRPTFAPTCYCDPASRSHKWGLVLETVHYALVQRDKQLAAAPAPAIQ